MRHELKTFMLTFTVLAAIYLLISILSEVDPLYRDKIGAIREVLNLTERG